MVSFARYITLLRSWLHSPLTIQIVLELYGMRCDWLASLRYKDLIAFVAELGLCDLCHDSMFEVEG